jgi:paired amphipathic helix protein Sin3a
LWRIPSKANYVTTGREEVRRERWIMKAKAGEWNPDLVVRKAKESTPVQAGKEQTPVSVPVSVSELEPVRVV